MKKIFAMAFAVCAFASCNNSETTDTSSADTIITTTEPELVTVTRAPAEGDVAYNGGKVQVYHSNAWVDADEDVKLDNGIIIYPDGRAVRDGDEVVLEDGYIVDNDGNVWDRTGNVIGDVWHGTKTGVSKAGQGVGKAAQGVGKAGQEAGKAIGKAAKKVGEKAKDAVD